MYDLLIKGGTAIDPARGLNAALDVAVTAGRVAKLDTSIPVSEAKEVIDASNKIVAPGLIDLHAHVFRQDHVVRRRCRRTLWRTGRRHLDHRRGQRRGSGFLELSGDGHSAMPQPDL
jgi:predicted amidohydrolase